MMPDYANRSQQRIIRLVELLAGEEKLGLSLTEVSDALKVPSSMALRDLRNLEATGWGRRMETGRWCMDIGAAKPLAAVRDGIEKGRERLNQIEKDYLGGENG